MRTRLDWPLVQSEIILPSVPEKAHQIETVAQEWAQGVVQRFQTQEPGVMTPNLDPDTSSIIDCSLNSDEFFALYQADIRRDLMTEDQIFVKALRRQIARTDLHDWNYINNLMSFLMGFSRSEYLTLVDEDLAEKLANWYGHQLMDMLNLDQTTARIH